MAAAEYAARNSVPPPAPTFADQQAIIQATYIARMQRRSMPPRCNPFTILLLVLSAGIFFIGITMTVIANWPGATSIGENPLRIAGPVLLGVGGALFILGMILVCVINSHERAKWDQTLGNMVAARLNSAAAEDRDQGLLIPDSGVGIKIQPGIRSSGGEDNNYSKPTDGYGYNQSRYGPRVETLPDPKALRAANGKAGSVSSAEGDQNSVPTPLRVTKKRRQRPPGNGDVSGGSSATNQSLTVSIGEADLGIPGMTSSQRVSSASGVPGQYYSNLSFEGDGAGGKPRAGGKNGRQQTVDPIRNPVMRNVAIQQQQLRVHIKAQPGTAVHITPTPTPPRGGTPRGAAGTSRGHAGQVQIGHPSAPRNGHRTNAADSETEI